MVVDRNSDLRKQLVLYVKEGQIIPFENLYRAKQIKHIYKFDRPINIELIAKKAAII